jgi:carbon-monoxide dehydrogenase medium subunit
MTTHYQVIKDPLIRQHCGLIAQATETVADPAGDLPAVAMALDASFVVAGAGGARRTVPAAEFFLDYLQTAVQPDELLVEIRVPKLGDGWGFHYEKFHRVAQAWAVVGVAAAVRRSNGSIAEARLGLTNMGSRPVRAVAVESALSGAEVEPRAVASACEGADDGTDPPSDIGGQADYRRHLARVLTRRAVLAAAGA